MNDLLTLEKQNKHTPKKINTFEEVISLPKPKNKRVPKIIVKRTNSKDTSNLQNTISHYLIKDKSIHFLTYFITSSFVAFKELKIF